MVHRLGHTRRNQDSADSADQSSRPSIAGSSSDHSHATTPRATPAPTGSQRPLGGLQDSSVSTNTSTLVDTGSKRLGSSSQSTTQTLMSRAVSPLPSNMALPPRSSSRAEGALKDLMPPTANTGKPHTSPVKVNITIQIVRMLSF